MRYDNGKRAKENKESNKSYVVATDARLYSFD